MSLFSGRFDKTMIQKKARLPDSIPELYDLAHKALRKPFQKKSSLDFLSQKGDTKVNKKHNRLWFPVSKNTIYCVF